jgi:penicillin amidase
LSSLASAYQDCRARLGEDDSLWAWGRLHQTHFVHALSGFERAEAAPKLDVGPFAQGGSESTPMQSKCRPGDFSAVLGASVRLVVDVGDWDKSVCVNAPGQSGDVRSTHYSDLAPLWAVGKYVPLLFSTGAVDEETLSQIDLIPS